MRRFLLAALAVALIAPGVGCGGAVDDVAGQDAAAVDPFEEYRLGPGDRLQINVFGQDDLSGEYAVDASGNLAFPILGAVDAGDRSVNEVREELVASLADGYVINPRVSIEVLNYRPFYVLGEVRRPGSYPFVAGIDVRQAVAIAGGYNRRARKSPVIISRRVNEEIQRIAVDPDTLVLPGDTIDVERHLFRIGLPKDTASSGEMISRHNMRAAGSSDITALCGNSWISALCSSDRFLNYRHKLLVSAVALII